MLKLFCAQKQECVADMLSVVITMFTSINFVKVDKILIMRGVNILGTKKNYN